MRRAFIFLFALLAFTTSRGKGTRPGDSCYLIIYRSGKFSGSLENFTIWVDNVRLCKLSNGRYFKVGVTPGKHILTAKLGGVGIAKKQTELPVDCSAGQPSYVSCMVKSSALRPRLELESVPADMGSSQISAMKVDDCQGSVQDQ